MKKILLILLIILIAAAFGATLYMWLSQAAEYSGYEQDYSEIAEQAAAITTPVPEAPEAVASPPSPRPTSYDTPATPSPAPANAQSPERVNVDFTKLLSQNSDTIGWLYIPGTKINYPVVQGADNEYYLNRNFKNRQAGCGALFMDCQNNSDPLDRNTVVFGHNMRNSSLMFSTLTNFKQQSYWQEHTRMQFDTPTAAGYWRVFAVCHLRVNTLEQLNLLQQDFISDADFERFVDAIRSQALFSTDIVVPSDAKLLTLVTCDRSNGFGKAGRLIVVAVLE